MDRNSLEDDRFLEESKNFNTWFNCLNKQLKLFKQMFIWFNHYYAKILSRKLISKRSVHELDSNYLLVSQSSFVTNRIKFINWFPKWVLKHQFVCYFFKQSLLTSNDSSKNTLSFSFQPLQWWHILPIFLVPLKILLY